MQYNKDIKKRLVTEITKLCVVFVSGLIYYFVVMLTAFKIPCLFHEITGFLCPGCGITRMIISITRLDFYSAFLYNKAVFLTIPIIFCLIFSMERRYILTGSRKLTRLEKNLAWAEIALLVIFVVVRNF